MKFIKPIVGISKIIDIMAENKIEFELDSYGVVIIE